MTHKLTVFSGSENDFIDAETCLGESSPASPTLVEPTVTLDQLREENRRLRSQLSSRALRDIIGQSPAVVRLREEIAVTDDDFPMLIQGESGCGLETAAHAIHACGKRSHRPFIKIDCNLLTAERLAWELSLADHPASMHHDLPFGQTSTRFGLARGGTLFIKNIDAMPLPLQKKLAALIRQQRLEAATAPLTRSTDMRVITASHANLDQLVSAQRFRADLRDKISECRLSVPSLRERVSDIALLVEHFLTRIAVAEGKPAKRLTIDALKLLHAYNWPGNLAELCNVIERACLAGPGELMTADVVRPWIGSPLEPGAENTPGLSLREMERKLIETTFARCEGNRERTAKTLQIGLRTLSGKLREYGYPPRGGPSSKLQETQLRAA